MEVEFGILGRPFMARGVDEHLGRWLENFWHYPQHTAAASSYHLALSAIGEAPDLTESTWIRRKVTLTDRVLELANRGPRWIGMDGDTGVELRVSPTGAEVYVWGQGWTGSENVYHYLYLAITEALRVSGLLPLHAALVARDDRVIALLGPSGAGKSTTLLRLVRAGWKPLAEDLCWLEPETLRVFGWDRGVRLWPENAERFFAGATPDPGRDGKTLISYDRVGDEERRDGVLTDVALLLREDDQAPRWESVGGAAGVRGLWEATGVPLSDEGRAQAGVAVERIARQVRFSRLAQGRLDAPLPDAPGGPVNTR